MELTISNLKRDRAKKTVGKESAALFRHYRVVARRQRPELFSTRVNRGTNHYAPISLPITAVEAD